MGTPFADGGAVARLQRNTLIFGPTNKLQRLTVPTVTGTQTKLKKTIIYINIYMVQLPW